jgi:RHS repeat-associated protein
MYATGTQWPAAGASLDHDTALSTAGARYYDPQLGRWLNEDPTGYQDDLNLYRYVRNNPVVNVDASGLAAKCILDSWSQAHFPGLAPILERFLSATGALGAPAPCHENRFLVSRFATVGNLVFVPTQPGGCSNVYFGSRKHLVNVIPTLSLDCTDKKVCGPTGTCCKATPFPLTTSRRYAVPVAFPLPQPDEYLPSLSVGLAGLIATPGQGPLLGGAAGFPGYFPSCSVRGLLSFEVEIRYNLGHCVYNRQQLAVVAASTAGSALGQGPLVGASALFPGRGQDCKCLFGEIK